MEFDKKRELLEYLSGFVTQNKLDLFERIIRFRTRHIAVVLEDLYQPHNASAVLRTCDCFGIQDVHIIENNNRYEVNPDVALGSSNWLTLIKYNRLDYNTPEAFDHLRKNGYQIILTSPHKNDMLLEELPVEKKTALVFGSEMRGLTDKAISQADGWVKVPMVGFTESLNISVSAAVMLYYLTGKLRKSNIQWALSDEEMVDIKLSWLKKAVKSADLLEQRFLKK
jgi:tRNA (guanosine-2'-O-)-methyltransferase